MRPIFSDSLPFSTFAKATYSLLLILFPNLEGFRQELKKFIKIFSFTYSPFHKFTNKNMNFRLQAYRIKNGFDELEIAALPTVTRNEIYIHLPLVLSPQGRGKLIGRMQYAPTLK